MRPSDPLLLLFRFFLTPSILALIYLYTYPVWQMCSFPAAKRPDAECYTGTNRIQSAWYNRGETAPFRLLALADPQLEGDTSLPEGSCQWNWRGDAEALWKGFEKKREVDGLAVAVKELVAHDAPSVLQGYRKRLDLWGNDQYLALIYRTMSWWTHPTHTAVLGDLVGSQWIGDDEFKRRSSRFWDVVFGGAEKVPRLVTDVRGKVELLGDDEEWEERVIAVAGNHDIGYAGDIDEHRVQRYEAAFGALNWDVRLRLNDSRYTDSQSLLTSSSAPELRVIVLNSMNLDEPALKPELRQQSLDFLDSAIHSNVGSSKTSTILLTHIPLHKEEGICTDAPFFDYFPASEGGGIKEQNHLSQGMSQHILQGLLPKTGSGDGSGGAIVLNGHDHTGCDTYHHRPRSSSPPAPSSEQDESLWQATQSHISEPDRLNISLTGVREITVQSMMGQYGGNAGLLSAWWDASAGEWKFDYNFCVLGVQHVWWGIHAVAIVETVLGLTGGMFWVFKWLLVKKEVKDLDRAKKDA